MDISQYENHRKNEVLLLCQKKSDTLIQLGWNFCENNATKNQRERDMREEIASGAQYLHRGYYCPSPTRDIIISNARRGMLLHRSTKRSKPTHRFYFDSNNYMRIVEFLSPNDQLTVEYLEYTGNAVLGFAYDAQGNIATISEEMYNDEKLISYFFASCFPDGLNRVSTCVTNACYEVYHYDENGLLDVEMYNINFLSEAVRKQYGLEPVIDGCRMRFSRQDGFLSGFYPIGLDGKQPQHVAYINPVTVRRKAF